MTRLDPKSLMIPPRDICLAPQRTFVDHYGNRLREDVSGHLRDSFGSVVGRMDGNRICDSLGSTRATIGSCGRTLYIGDMPIGKVTR